MRTSNIKAVTAVKSRQPGMPTVWMRAKTHWRKKMKKNVMKLKELSALPSNPLRLRNIGAFVVPNRF
ncbi:hypothetical protein EYF80_023012 [Liparis tanakae]|uniref:Uncharacterized protein n=1 Tax=Liparis tanakae TaxID=230148 RepID=A0A4Z2HMG9_9TELE|nr:hypothetical protein EYF80_023012 [Liparis tanakae]